MNTKLEGVFQLSFKSGRFMAFGSQFAKKTFIIFKSSILQGFDMCTEQNKLHLLIIYRLELFGECAFL